MFSTPIIRVQNHENTGGVAARKAKLTDSVSRKAFQDRDVNRTLQQNNQIRNKLGDIKVPQLKKVEPKYPDWLLDTCSYKPVAETFEDILPKEMRLGRRDISKLKSRATHSTQPNSPEMEPPPISPIEIDPFVLELPKPREKLVFNYLEVEDLPIPKMLFDFDI